MTTQVQSNQKPDWSEVAPKQQENSTNIFSSIVESIFSFLSSLFCCGSKNDADLSNRVVSHTPPSGARIVERAVGQPQAAVPRSSAIRAKKTVPSFREDIKPLFIQILDHLEGRNSVSHRLAENALVILRELVPQLPLKHPMRAKAVQMLGEFSSGIPQKPEAESGITSRLTMLTTTLPGASRTPVTSAPAAAPAARRATSTAASATQRAASAPSHANPGGDRMNELLAKQRRLIANGSQLSVREIRELRSLQGY